MSVPNIELTSIPVQPQDISTNLQVGVVIVIEDKLIRILEGDRERTRKNMFWAVPASFFISLLVAILTTDFKNRWGISSEIWAALFYLATFLSAISVFISLFRIKNKTINEVIQEIKGK